MDPQLKSILFKAVQALSITLGGIGLSAVVTSILYIYDPNLMGNLAPSNPATTFWQGLILIYLSFDSFYLTYNFEQNSYSKIYYTYLTSMQNGYLYLFLKGIAIFPLFLGSLFFNISRSPDLLAGFIMLLNFLVIYYSVVLRGIMYFDVNAFLNEIGKVKADVSKIVNIALNSLLALLEGIMLMIIYLTCIREIYEISGQAPFDAVRNSNERVVSIVTPDGSAYSTTTYVYDQGIANTRSILLIEPGYGGSGHLYQSLCSTLQPLVYPVSVLTYDRAGYGNSHSGKYQEDSFKDQMEYMLAMISALGVNIQNPNIRIVCAGHQHGGQLCQYYAQKLDIIKGVILMDSFPFQREQYLFNKGYGLTKDQSIGDVFYDISQASLQSVLAPLYINSFFTNIDNEFFNSILDCAGYQDLVEE
eukprot:403345576